MCPKSRPKFRKPRRRSTDVAPSNDMTTIANDVTNSTTSSDVTNSNEVVIRKLQTSDDIKHGMPLVIISDQ